MNGKFILLFTVCLNIVSLLLSFGCADVTTGCSIGTNVILNLFISEDTINSELDQYGGFAFDDSLIDGVEELVEPQSSGIGTTFAFVVDLGAMILGLLFLFTPIPMIAFMMSLGFPVWLNLIFSVPLFALFIVSLMEFVGGRQF